MYRRDVSAHTLTLMALETQLLGSFVPKDNKWPQMVWTLSGLCWVVLAHLNSVFLVLSLACFWAWWHYTRPVAVWARPHAVTTWLFRLCTLLSSPVIPLLSRTYLNPQHECVPHRRAGCHINKELRSRTNMLIAGTPGDVDCLSHPDKTHVAQT